MQFNARKAISYIAQVSVNRKKIKSQKISVANQWVRKNSGYRYDK